MEVIMAPSKCASSSGGNSAARSSCPLRLDRIGMKSREVLAFLALVQRKLQVSCQQQRKTQQEAEKQAQVHPAQQRVVAQVVEMRHAALLGSEVADRRCQVDRADAAPYQPHRGF